MEPTPRPSPIAVLLRGMAKRCPRCARGPLFRRWYTLHDQCTECRLSFHTYEGDTWAFMYVSTAGITGLIVVVMLLATPADTVVGRIVLVAAAIALIVGTLPTRKGIGIAIDYLAERWWSPPQKD